MQKCVLIKNLKCARASMRKKGRFPTKINSMKRAAGSISMRWPVNRQMCVNSKSTCHDSHYDVKIISVLKMLIQTLAEMESTRVLKIPFWCDQKSVAVTYLGQPPILPLLSAFLQPLCGENLPGWSTKGNPLFLTSIKKSTLAGKVNSPLKLNHLHFYQRLTHAS